MKFELSYRQVLPRPALSTRLEIMPILFDGTPGYKNLSRQVFRNKKDSKHSMSFNFEIPDDCVVYLIYTYCGTKLFNPEAVKRVKVSVEGVSVSDMDNSLLSNQHVHLATLHKVGDIVTCDWIFNPFKIRVRDYCNQNVPTIFV